MVGAPPKPEELWHSMGISWLTFKSQTPYKLGALPSVSGSHQPCRAWAILGCMVGVNFALRFILPLTPSIQTHSPSWIPSVFRGLRVQFHRGIGTDLSQPGYHAVFTVEKDAITPAGNQDQRVLLIDIRGAYGALNRLLMVRQGVQSVALEDG